MKISGLSLHKKSILFTLLCIGTITAFVLLVLYPNHQKIVEYELEITNLENQIETRKSIIPVYKELLKRVRLNPANGLILPDKTSIGVDKTDVLKTVLQDIASSCRLELTYMIPDARSYSEESGRLRADAVFTGEFLNFQKLLWRIGEVSFLDKIEKIHIQTDENRKSIQLTLLLIEKQGL